VKYYPCLCLCFGLEQITIIRPRLRINQHFSQILRTVVQTGIIRLIAEILKMKKLARITLSIWKKKNPFFAIPMMQLEGKNNFL